MVISCLLTGHSNTSRFECCNLSDNEQCRYICDKVRTFLRRNLNLEIIISKFKFREIGIRLTLNIFRVEVVITPKPRCWKQ